MKIRYRVLLVIAVVGCAFIYYFFPCLMLNIKNIPGYDCLNKNNDIRRIIILYGGKICFTCSTGEFIDSLRDTKSILFVVPDDYSDIDIENFRDSFKIEGLIIRGGEHTADFLKNLAGCRREGDWQKNYLLTLNENKKFKTIKPI